MVEVSMDALVEKPDTKLRQCQPDVGEQVRQYVAEITDLPDRDTLDILRSRIVEQEELDLLDERETRWSMAGCSGVSGENATFGIFSLRRQALLA